MGSLPPHAGALITSVIMEKVSGTAREAAVTNPELTVSVGKEVSRALRLMTQEIGITKTGWRRLFLVRFSSVGK